MLIMEKDSIKSFCGQYRAWVIKVKSPLRWFPWLAPKRKVWVTNWTEPCYYTHDEVVALMRYAVTLDRIGVHTAFSDEVIEALVDYWSEVLDVDMDHIDDELRQGRVIDLSG